MDHGRRSTAAIARTAAPWALIFLVLLTGSAFLRAGSLRREALQTVLVLMAAGETLAGFMLMFRARRMAEMAGRPYSVGYHGLHASPAVLRALLRRRDEHPDPPARARASRRPAAPRGPRGVALVRLSRGHGSWSSARGGFIEVATRLPDRA
jgi:hypothetical protein